MRTEPTYDGACARCGEVLYYDAGWGAANDSYEPIYDAIAKFIRISDDGGTIRVGKCAACKAELYFEFALLHTKTVSDAVVWQRRTGLRQFWRRMMGSAFPEQLPGLLARFD